MLMLTGQDAFIRSSQHMPWYTKIVVSLSGLLSVAMFALPVSLLTWGFEAEACRLSRKTSRQLKRSATFESQGYHNGNNNYKHPPNSIPIMKVDSMNSDEEYLKIIAKETDDDESARGVSDESKKKINELVERYLKEDSDGKKFVALADFLMDKIPYDHQEDQSLVAGLGESFDAADMRHRMANVEYAVELINTKLDSLVRLMEVGGREVRKPIVEDTLSSPSSTGNIV
jgi:hypothetical protein